MSLVDKAMEIAIRAHHGQTNQHDNEPYLLHVIRVVGGLNVPTTVEQCVAWLHDAFEDNPSDWPLGRIEATLLEEAPQSSAHITKIIEAVDAISKRAGESNEEYYGRVKRNDVATTVKLSDIRDNFRRNHLIDDEKTRLRMAKKYSLGLDVLSK